MYSPIHSAPEKPEKATKSNPEHGNTRTSRIEKKDVGNMRDEKPENKKRKDN